MNIWITFLIFIFISSFSFAENSLDSEVQNFFDKITISLNNQALQEITDAWSMDGEIVTLAGGIYKGPKEIADFWAEGFAGPYKKAKFYNFIQYIRFSDANHAIVDGVWKVEGGPQNYPACGIFLYNLSKQNGKWKLDIGYSSVPRQGHTAEHGRTLSWVKICNE